MYIGDSKADNYLRTYSQALIQKNDDDEFTILSIAAAAASKSVTVASEDFDENKSTDEALYTSIRQEQLRVQLNMNLNSRRR